MKQLAKCLDTLRITDGLHLVIRNPLVLCYDSHVICGGEHPPNCTVLEETLCGACRCRGGRDSKGQKQHL